MNDVGIVTRSMCSLSISQLGGQEQEHRVILERIWREKGGDQSLQDWWYKTPLVGLRRCGAGPVLRHYPSIKECLSQGERIRLAIRRNLSLCSLS